MYNASIYTLTILWSIKNSYRNRKQPSGFQNRKRKQRKDDEAKLLVGSILKLFEARNKRSQTSNSSQDEEATLENENNDFNIDIHEDKEPINEIVEVEIEDQHMEETNDVNVGAIDEGVDDIATLDLEKDVDINYDPGLWGK